MNSYLITYYPSIIDDLELLVNPVIRSTHGSRAIVDREGPDGTQAS